MTAQLPGGERRALIARPGLVDPDMDRDAAIMGQVDRRQRGAPVDRRQPAGVAVGEHVDRTVLAGVRPRLFDDLQAVPADGLVGRHVFIADLPGPRVGRGGALGPGPVAQPRAQIVERPLEIDRRRPGLGQGFIGPVHGLVGGVGAQPQAQAIGRRGADQRGAAHQHGADRVGRLGDRGQAGDDELVRQAGLVDDMDRPAILGQPDGAIGDAVDFHGKARLWKRGLPG